MACHRTPQGGAAERHKQNLGYLNDAACAVRGRHPHCTATSMEAICNLSYCLSYPPPFVLYKVWLFAHTFEMSHRLLATYSMVPGPHSPPPGANIAPAMGNLEPCGPSCVACFSCPSLCVPLGGFGGGGGGQFCGLG